MENAARRRTYWTTVVVTFLLLQTLCVWLLFWLDHIGVGKNLAGWSGVAIMPLFMTASGIAAANMKRRGISMAARTVEVLRNPRPDVPTPTIELRHNPATYRGMALLCGGFSVFVFLLLRFARSVPGTEIYGYIVAVGMAVIASLFLVANVRKWGFVARMNDAGITYSCFGKRFVGWDRIAVCAIVTTRNALGDRSSTVVVLNDSENHRLGTFFLNSASHADAGEFARRLTAQFDASSCSPKNKGTIPPVHQSTT